jgi:UDP:flavonoid glycosyltransferase YjiC (YdhE family)
MMQQVSKKPLLLIFPFDVLAHNLRCLKLADQLQDYFEVKFIWSEKYHSFIQSHGYQTFDCKTFNAEYVQKCIRDFNFSWLNKADLEKIYLNQVQVLERLQPLAVLGDTMPTLKMAAEKTGIKYLSLMNGYISRHHADVHEMPSKHPLYKYVKALPTRVQDFFVEIGEQKSYRQIHEPFRALRSKYGLSKKYSYEDELEGEVNLLCDLKELFPQKWLPENYYEIPPLFYESIDEEDEIVEKLDSNKKTVFVSMGSTGEWKNVAFLNNPYFSKFNIVTAGDHNSIISAPNVIKASFVNIHDLFPHTDLVICHGGNGTIYQSLLYSIPLLCRTSHFEQQWNVNKLEKMQLGKSLDEVNELNEQIQIIEEWIIKKRTNNFVFIEDKIREALDEFPVIIDRMVEANFSEVATFYQLEKQGEAKKIA